jgi:RND superfamily putative drug exporter
VIGGWLAVIAVIAVLSSTFGASYTSVFTLPGSETQDAVELLQERFPEAAGDSATIVFHSTDAPIDDPVIQEQMAEVVAQARELPGVVYVTGPADNPQQISPNGQIAYASVQYSMAATDVEVEDVEALFDLIETSSTSTLQVEAGGQIVTAGEAPEIGSSEIFGIIIAMVILFGMFGSVVAMGLPVVTALIGVGIGILAMPLFANVFTLHSQIATAFLSMMGLGVGIDYALFIVNRFRDNLLHGQNVVDATSVAIDTAGRSVAFAGVTVAIGLLGLSLIGIPIITGLGITGSVIVLIAVLIALFLMPAILGLVGNRIFLWRVPGLGKTSTGRTGFWFKWGRLVQARPGIVSTVTLVALLMVAVPYFDMNLNLSDAGNNPESMTSRRAYDLMAEGFGPGSNGPLVIVLEKDGGLSEEALAAVNTTLGGIEGIGVSPAMPNEAGNTALVQVIPGTGPQDVATEDLIRSLRNDILPGVADENGIVTYVAGSTAANIDMSQQISDRMPLFYAVVIGLSFLLLTVVFRSLVVPLKAALTTLLAVGASFGAVVAVFQWGWLQSLFGIEGTGPIESFLPMLLFGVLFGLSMDYEVFLLSRVHEEHANGQPARLAMLDGVGYSGRVVAAAGAIMAAVFLSFVLEELRMLQMIGFGLGIAVLIDAFVVRMVLVPAIMTVLDERAWWFPSWLNRIVPNINVEGNAPQEEPAPRVIHQSPTSVAS